MRFPVRKSKALKSIALLLTTLALLSEVSVEASTAVTKKTEPRRDAGQWVAKSDAKDAEAKHIVRTVTSETLKTISTKDEAVDAGPILAPAVVEVEAAPGALKLAEELNEATAVKPATKPKREPSSKNAGLNASNLGVYIKPLAQADGLRLGVQFTADFLAVTLSVAARDISPDQGAKIYAQFWDSASENLFSDVIWQKPLTSAPPAGATYVVHAGSSGAAASGLVARLKSMKLVLTIAQGGGTERTVHFDLGSLCATNPGNFMNLDSGARGCP